MDFSLPLFLLKVSFASFIFFGFYLAFLRNKTFFQVNRFYLLYTLLISFCIPFIQSPISDQVTLEKGQFYNLIAQPVSTQVWHWQYENFLPLQESPVIYSFSFGDLFLVIYFLGILFFLLRLIRKFWGLARIIRNSDKIEREGQLTWTHPKVPVSSFFSYLFWNDDRNKDGKLLIAHEKVHMSQWHSSDIVLLEVSKIILWFNPVINYMIREIRLLHEYIADKAVVHQTQDKSAYLDVLKTHCITGAPTLTHHFSSFLKRRIQMLHRKRSSIYSYGFYLLFIPILIGIGILVMAPGKESLFSKVEGQWKDFQEKNVVTLKVGDERSSNDIRLECGKKTFTFPVHAESKYHHVLDQDLDIQDIKEILNSKLKIIDPQNDGAVKEESYISSCQSFDHPDVAEIGNDINATDKWQSFLAAVKANPDAMSDGCIMYFLLRKGEKLYTCRFHIKDESTRKRYLLANDTRLMTLKYVHRDFIAPPDFKNNINQLSIKDLTEILSASEHRIYDYSDNYIIRDFDFYFADDLTRPLDRKKLLKKFTQDHYLSKSLVLITRVSEDQKYAIMLDDAKISPFTFNTWDDYFRQPVELPLPERSIDEQISLKWHSLSIESPRDFRYLGNFRINADNKLTEAELEQMLRSVPTLKINNRKIDQFSIRFKYVDHEYLPFSCQFNFDQGKLIAGDEFKVAIMDRLKPDDFITTFEVTTEGRILLRSSNIKIR